MRAQLHELTSGHSPKPSSCDEELVAECLAGNQKAWTALVAKYQRLVYSVPLRFHMRPEDAADVFQAVWLELYEELPRLRQPNAVRGWLLTTAFNRCYRSKMKNRKNSELAASYALLDSLAESKEASQLYQDFEREQMLREAIANLPERCQNMVRMLFYADPPLPYSEVAAKLGLAQGSVGFIRGRCLQKLRLHLENLGF